MAHLPCHAFPDHTKRTFDKQRLTILVVILITVIRLLIDYVCGPINVPLSLSGIWLILTGWLNVAQDETVVSTSIWNLVAVIITNQSNAHAWSVCRWFPGGPPSITTLPACSSGTTHCGLPPTPTSDGNMCLIVILYRSVLLVNYSTVQWNLWTVATHNNQVERNDLEPMSSTKCARVFYLPFYSLLSLV